MVRTRRTGRIRAMNDGLREFHDVGCKPAYEIEVDPEFPPDGNWLVPFLRSIRTVALSPDSRLG